MVDVVISADFMNFIKIVREIKKLEKFPNMFFSTIF